VHAAVRLGFEEADQISGYSRALDRQRWQGSGAVRLQEIPVRERAERRLGRTFNRPWSLGHVGLDGTTVKANASKHKAMTHELMLRAEKQLAQQINALIHKTKILDAQEDRRYGKTSHGIDLPDDLLRRQVRLKRIPQARMEMEAETAAAAAR